MEQRPVQVEIYLAFNYQQNSIVFSVCAFDKKKILRLIIERYLLLLLIIYCCYILDFSVINV